MPQGPANKHCVGFAIENHPNFDFVVSIASTTHVDRHNERMSSESMDDFVEAVRRRYQPYRFNHDPAFGTIGALISARSFQLPDGESAVAILIVFYTRGGASMVFPAGQKNEHFDDYLHHINVERLIEVHELEMKNSHDDEPVSLEEALEAFMDSHILHDDGTLEVHKHYVTRVGDLNIEIYPGDHPPAHFHAISIQRKMNIRFNLDTLEVDSVKQGNIGGKDAKLIKMFFTRNPNELAKLRKKAKAMRVGELLT